MSQRQRRRKARRRTKAAVTGVAVGAAVLGGPSAADATQYTVTNLSDHDSGSLRDALTQSNADPNPDQIVFQSGLSGQIDLATELAINSPIDIQGPGAGVITVSGSNSTRIFNASLPSDFDASISGLTLTHGSSSDGAGVLQLDGDLTISSSVIRDSHASGRGAGIFMQGQSDGTSLTVVRSTISGNTADGNGGGIAALVTNSGTDETRYSSVDVRYSTISGNHAGGGNGGGVSAETLAYGFASYYDSYSCYCTVPGAYPNSNLSVRFEHSTVAGNTAGGSGGGIHVREGEDNYGNAYSGAVIRNTVVADNTGAGGLPNDTDTDGGTIQGDFSLVEADGAPVNPINETSMIFGRDPQLGPLQDNGGPTPTMALPKTSPAVDKGNKYQATTDQRGLPREADWQDVPNSTARFWDGTDMGAFELQIPPPPPIPAECNSTEATQQGTDGNDLITGTPGRDVIQGLGGNDTIRGLGGNDLLCGGAGKDKGNGGAGNDIVFGEAGGDQLQGGQGKDFLLGGGGADTLLGGGGTDSLLGGGGKDKLNGGPGKDLEKQ